MVLEEGVVVGNFTVLRKATKDEYNKRFPGYWCRCICGKEKIISTTTLYRKNRTEQSCGCIRTKKLKERRTKNEVGNRYGKLTVIERCGSTDRGLAIFRCICDCGVEVTTLGYYLRQGWKKSCGCLIKIDYKNEIGKKYNRWTIIDVSDGNYDTTTCICRCDCGVERTVKLTMIKTGRSKSCGCYRLQKCKEAALPYGVAGFNQLFGRYKHSAEKRGYSFDLSVEEFRLITLQNCYYCGAEPYQNEGHKKSNGKYVYNGIDRKDSNVGYTLTNCVACCGRCNVAKNKTNHDDFIQLARDIVKIHGIGG